MVSLPVACIGIGTHGFFFYGLLHAARLWQREALVSSLVPCMQHSLTTRVAAGCSMRFAAGGELRANSASSIMGVALQYTATTAQFGHLWLQQEHESSCGSGSVLAVAQSGPSLLSFHMTERIRYFKTQKTRKAVAARRDRSSARH